MKHTIELTAANFDAEVIRSETPVLVDFWATWCGPCRMIAPILDEIAEEQIGRAKIAKLNTETDPELAARYGVKALPTMLIFVGGEVRETIVGTKPKRELTAKLEALLAPAI